MQMRSRGVARVANAGDYRACPHDFAGRNAGAVRREVHVVGHAAVIMLDDEDVGLIEARFGWPATTGGAGVAHLDDGAGSGGDDGGADQGGEIRGVRLPARMRCPLAACLGNGVAVTTGNRYEIGGLPNLIDGRAAVVVQARGVAACAHAAHAHAHACWRGQQAWQHVIAGAARRQIHDRGAHLNGSIVQPQYVVAVALQTHAICAARDRQLYRERENQMQHRQA